MVLATWGSNSSLAILAGKVASIAAASAAPVGVEKTNGLASWRRRAWQYGRQATAAATRWVGSALSSRILASRNSSGDTPGEMISRRLRRRTALTLDNSLGRLPTGFPATKRPCSSRSPAIVKFTAPTVYLPLQRSTSSCVGLGDQRLGLGDLLADLPLRRHQPLQADLLAHVLGDGGRRGVVEVEQRAAVVARQVASAPDKDAHAADRRPESPAFPSQGKRRGLTARRLADLVRTKISSQAVHQPGAAKWHGCFGRHSYLWKGLPSFSEAIRVRSFQPCRHVFLSGTQLEARWGQARGLLLRAAQPRPGSGIRTAQPARREVPPRRRDRLRTAQHVRLPAPRRSSPAT